LVALLEGVARLEAERAQVAPDRVQVRLRVRDEAHLVALVIAAKSLLLDARGVLAADVAVGAKALAEFLLGGGLGLGGWKGGGVA
jgi:hypothetical protein